MKATAFKATAFLVAAGIAFAQTPSTWTPEFSLQFKTIGEVVPSPDGARVAWTQTQAVMEPETSEMQSQIFLANADGSHRIPLTRAGKGTASPAFSLDGAYVYFKSERSGKNNLYRIAVAGGEAEMLTEVKGDLGV